ncbi:Uncharacterised protein [Legionella busanensis]|uniref:Uncharacterized protein n=1 Tax=Legionella busanensis TaxID=190655 RepID=A0A378JH25_9GAMM|nr:hypothetical protein [Legionella busanensis]STX50424.1 Uncharacterised protein [Legionella busanensis]
MAARVLDVSEDFKLRYKSFISNCKDLKEKCTATLTMNLNAAQAEFNKLNKIILLLEAWRKHKYKSSNIPPTHKLQEAMGYLKLMEQLKTRK